MMEYLIFLTIPLFALLRVMDGGWHRLPGSNIILWLAPSAALYGATMNPYVASAGLLLGRQWTQGYGDLDGDGTKGWEDAWWDMLIRCHPTAAFVLFCGLLYGAGLYQPDWTWLGLGLGAVVVSNVIQPWLRTWADGKGWWPNHSNRYAEGLEGGCLALLVLSV